MINNRGVPLLICGRGIRRWLWVPVVLAVLPFAASCGGDDKGKRSYGEIGVGGGGNNTEITSTPPAGGGVVNLASVDPSSGAPGSQATLSGSFSESPERYLIRLGDVEMVPWGGDTAKLLFSVPLLPPGSRSLEVIGPGRERSATLSFEVLPLPPPPVGQEDASGKLAEGLAGLATGMAGYLKLAQEGGLVTGDIDAFAKNEIDPIYDYFKEVARYIESLPAEERRSLDSLFASEDLGKVFKSSARFMKSPSRALADSRRAPSQIDPMAQFKSLVFGDQLSAGISAIEVIVSGVCVVTAAGAAVVTAGTAGAGAPTLSVPVACFLIKFGLGWLDAAIDGLMPTDLEALELKRIVPEQGSIWNEGEEASLIVEGKFFSQAPPLVEFSGQAVSTILGAFTSANFNQVLPESVKGPLGQAFAAVINRILSYGAKAGAAKLVDGSALGQKIGPITVRVPMSFFEITLGEIVSSTFQAVLMMVNLSGLVSGEDIVKLLRRVEVDVDKPLVQAVIAEDASVVSFNSQSNTLKALRAGRSTLTLTAYRWASAGAECGEGQERQKCFKWYTRTLIGVLGVEIPAVVEKKNAYVVDISGSPEPPPSGGGLVSTAPLSGVVSGVFRLDGGSFTLSVSPVDSAGVLLSSSLTLENFSFSRITAAKSALPNQVVSTGNASPTTLEVRRPSASGVSVALVVDSSGSMSSNDPQRLRVSAGKNFVDKLGPADQMVVMDFGAGTTTGLTASRLLQDFTVDKTLLKAAVDKVAASGSTPLYDALKDAIKHIQSKGLTNGVVVVLTDGKDSGSQALPADVIALAKGAPIPIFTVGLGSSIDFSILQQIARDTGGTFGKASVATDMAAVFDAVRVGVSTGRIVVSASGFFVPLLPGPGEYVLRGKLFVQVGSHSVVTPFDFVVAVGGS